MEPKLSPDIHSFIIRFVVDCDNDGQQSRAYRGSIRHIQTAEELSFSEWQEASIFIQRYLPLEINTDSSSKSIAS